MFPTYLVYRPPQLHAARLLHKTSHQGEATARDLRITGVIPLLAEALATAAYGPNGARRPRRLLVSTCALKFYVLASTPRDASLRVRFYLRVNKLPSSKRLTIDKNFAHPLLLLYDNSTTASRPFGSVTNVVSLASHFWPSSSRQAHTNLSFLSTPFQML